MILKMMPRKRTTTHVLNWSHYMITVLLILIALSYWMALKTPSNNNVLRCGLFGGAGPHLDKAAVDRIFQLGIVSQLRGIDSTGILSCFREDGKIHFKIIKDVMHSTDFLNSRKIRGHFEDKKPFVIAGHCRAATVGAVNYDNAHPFGLGKILGMKNGTVPSIRGKKPDETDSKAMLRIIRTRV